MNLYCPSHKTSSNAYLQNYDAIRWETQEKEVNRETFDEDSEPEQED